MCSLGLTLGLSLGRHFDADMSGYGGRRVGVEPFVSVAVAVMDDDGGESSPAAEDNNDYLSRKRQKEQASYIYYRTNGP